MFPNHKQPSVLIRHHLGGSLDAMREPEPLSDLIQVGHLARTLAGPLALREGAPPKSSFKPDIKNSIDNENLNDDNSSCLVNTSNSALHHVRSTRTVLFHAKHCFTSENHKVRYLSNVSFIELIYVASNRMKGNARFIQFLGLNKELYGMVRIKLVNGTRRTLDGLRAL
jgi:hypothetical protein